MEDDEMTKLRKIGPGYELEVIEQGEGAWTWRVVHRELDFVLCRADSSWPHEHVARSAARGALVTLGIDPEAA